MTFAYSAGRITQSGTDTSLAGLTGLTGVTVVTDGPQTVYTLTATRLRNTGTLSWNGATERLVFRGATGLTSPVWAVDGDVTITCLLNGVYRDDLNCLDLGSVDLANFALDFITVSAGKIFTMQGGAITAKVSNNGRVFRLTGNGAKANLSDASFVNYTETPGSVQLSSGSGSPATNLSRCNFRGMLVNAGTATFLETFEDMVLTDGQEALVSNLGNTSAVISVANLSSARMSNQVARLRSSALGAFKFNNPSDGNDVVIALNTDSTNDVYAFIYQDVTFNITDSNGTPLSDAAVYGVDVDNGSRQPNITIASTTFTTASDRVYSGVGASHTFEILTQARRQVSPDDGTTATHTDNRGTSNGADFPFGFIAYNEAITVNTFATEGVGSKTFGVALGPDFSITEPDKAVVDAYTSIDSAAEFYDRAKSYLIANYARQSNTLVSRDGTTINAGSYNVVVDSSAASVLSISGSTITIKSSEFTGSITTTGAVTLLNGATVTGTIIDSTGTSVVINVNCSDAITGADVENARVYVVARSGGALSAGTEIVNALTDSSGNISERVSITPTQPATVRVRQGSVSPYYQASSNNVSIGAAGIDLNVSLIRDE